MPTSVLPVGAFVFIFVAAIVMILEVERWVPEPLFRNLLDHIFIAFMVASFLGFTYEWALHTRREDTLRRLFEEHRKKVFDSLKAYLLLSPEEIFDLLRDIACQTREMPTLYRPPREEANEYTFADRIKYFDTLIEVRRREIVEVLRSWIRPESHPNLKFLASDFIGMYKLCELAGALRAEVYPRLERWHLVTCEKEKGWILNYIWASSRCDDKMYSSLGSLLPATPHEWIPKWILFVPRQMPGPEFCQMITNYLGRGTEISELSRKEVVRALAVLQHAGACKGGAILNKFSSLSGSEELVQEIDKVWRNLGLDPEPIIRGIRD